MRGALAIPIAAAIAVVAPGCKSKTSDAPKPAPPDDAATRAAGPIDAAAQTGGIYLDPAKLDFASNPTLLERVLASPYGYFRFTNIQFSQAVCRRFSGRLRGMPTVNLHGDAHLENYAITKAGRGLFDFDDSSAGPAVLDLVRFGASIEVACAENGWEAEVPKLLDRFLSGYRDSLENPDLEVPAPDLVKSARDEFTKSRIEFLQFAETLMEPIPEPERAAFEPGYARYSELMLGEHPELPRSFFDIIRIGRISLGFGSALDRKYLIRVRGKTDRPDDDLVLEAKEVRDLSGIECINSRASGGAFRILVGQARIAEVPHEFLAQVPPADDTGARPFWVHAWHEHYVELNVGDELTPDNLDEVAYDVGVQLGRGHVRQIASPLDSQLRRAQLDILRTYDREIREVAHELAAQTLDGWERFKRDAKRAKLTP